MSHFSQNHRRNHRPGPRSPGPDLREQMREERDEEDAVAQPPRVLAATARQVPSGDDHDWENSALVASTGNDEASDNDEDENDDRRHARHDSAPTPREEEYLAKQFIAYPIKLRAALDVITLREVGDMVAGPVGALIAAGHGMLIDQDSFEQDGFKDRLKASLRRYRVGIENFDPLNLTDHIDELLADGGLIDSTLAEELTDDEWLQWANIKAYLFTHVRRVAGIHWEETRRLREKIEALEAMDLPQSAVDPKDERHPFPVHLLPASIARFVMDVCNSTLISPEMIVPTVLTVLGAAIGTARSITPKKGWQNFPIIWAASISETGNRKSPGTKPVCEPLNAIQIRADKTYRRLKRQYESRLRAWESAPRDTRGPAPRQPDYGHVITNDVTVEGMGKLLSLAPRGISVLMDELSDFIENLGQYKNKSNDQVKYMQFFDAKMTKIDRKGQEPLCLERPAVWICGTIQPPTFWKCFPESSIANGFMARFLLSFPTENIPVLNDIEIGNEVLQSWTDCINRLRALTFRPAIETRSACSDDAEPNDGDDCGADEFAENTEPVDLGVTEAAWNLFKEFYDRNALEIHTELDVPTRASWKKMPGYALKFALIDHLVHQVMTPNYTGREVAPAHPEAERDLVEADAMSRAIEIADWFRHEARRIFRMRIAMTSTADTDRNDLVAYIRNHGGRITARKLAQNMRRKFPRTEMAVEALKALAEERMGILDERTEVFTLNRNPS